MKLFLLFFFTFLFSKGFSQDKNISNTTFIGLEYGFGKATLPVIDYPNVSFQNSISFTVANTNLDKEIEWNKQLNFPKTGISFSYAKLGENKQLGNAFSIIPYLDFKIFTKKSDRFNFVIGMGASYFDTTFDEFENPKNKVISTRFNWAFRSHLYYQLLAKKKHDLKLGLGIFHNSNGHTRLPNNGLNVISFQVLSEFVLAKKEKQNTIFDSSFLIKKKNKCFFTTRAGVGQKVFSKYSTNKKEVFTYAASKGIIRNKTFQYGYGFSCRWYEDYYNYIKKEEKLIKDLYPKLKEKPNFNASSFSIFGSGELLLSHVGIEIEVGLNLYKPAYKIDWQINEETYKNNQYQLGELNWYYHIKRTISSRLGTKFYAVNTNKAPRNNFFLGTFINANFGQADFSELTLGYIYYWDKK